MAQDARVKRAHVCIVGTREFNFGFLFSPLFLYYTIYIYDNVIYNNMYVRLSKFPVKLYMYICMALCFPWHFMTLNMIPTALWHILKSVLCVCVTSLDVHVRYFRLRPFSISIFEDTHTNKQTNKQSMKQTNKQTSKQASKQASRQASNNGTPQNVWSVGRPIFGVECT